MKVVQAYIQGAKHKSENRPCEDRTYSLSKNGVDVIALADGAGSAKYSHSANGAECVTKTICEFFCNNFDKFYEKTDAEELKEVVVTICNRVLEEKAEELELDSISRLSSTLLTVAVKGDMAIVCHIGDGVIGKLTSAGTQVVSLPENGEFIGTTYFITNPNAQVHMTIIKETTDDVISYFMMSDGTQEYVFNKSLGNFSDAGRKMALMPFEEDGQERLIDIIQRYMIEKDAKSDDCSFICLAVKSSYDIPMNTDSKEVDVINHNSEDVVINHKTITEDERLRNLKSNKSSKTLLEQKGKLLIILSIFMAVIIMITIGISRKNTKKPTETTTKNIVTETKKEEKTTSKKDIVDCDKKSVSKETVKSKSNASEKLTIVNTETSKINQLLKKQLKIMNSVG